MRATPQLFLFLGALKRVGWRWLGLSAKRGRQRSKADDCGARCYLLLGQQELNQRLNLLVAQVGRQNRSH